MNVLSTFLDYAPPAWFTTARCQDGTGNFADLFFSEDLGDIARAKAICGNCPAREPCLQVATDRREPWGVWGGELFLNGKVMAAKRRRGRPPKHGRPCLIVDELGNEHLEEISA